MILYTTLYYIYIYVRGEGCRRRRRRLHLTDATSVTMGCVLLWFPARNDVKLAENRRAPRPSCSFVAPGRRRPFCINM